MKTLILSLIMLASCSFSGSKDGASKEETPTLRDLEPSEDLDGDGLSNLEEAKKGTSPYLADLPELEISFIQNFKIIGKFKDLESGEVKELLIDTLISRDNPEFKYQVGRSLLHSKALKEAARVGQFSNHSKGEISEFHIDQTSYPELDPSFYLGLSKKYAHLFNKDKYEITSLKAELEVSAKLKENRRFNSVNNLSVSFSFFNHELQSYEGVGYTTIKRHFNAGVKESFKVTLEELPPALLWDNLFKRGEFLVSKVDNYEIPEIKTSFKTLISKVKERSLPVVVNTPLKEKIHYVAVGSEGETLSEIIKRIWGDKSKIKEDKIELLGSFKSNLGSYKDLESIKSETKKGKWFVHTNKLNKSLLDYRFQKSDVLSLLFSTGEKLANQVRSNQASSFSYSTSGESQNRISLGKIEKRSKLYLNINPLKMFGVRAHSHKEVIQAPKCRGKNCYQLNFTCHFTTNTFKKIDYALKFKEDFSGESGPLMTLVIGGDGYSFKTLLSEKKIKVKLIEGALYLEIPDFSWIKFSEKELEVALVLKSKGVTISDGVVLTKVEGRHIQQCPMIGSQMAWVKKVPLSSDSHDFSKWQQFVNWKTVKRGSKRSSLEKISVSIQSNLKHFYN